MPNGGVPRWQGIKPVDSPLAIVCEGTGVKILDAADWDRGWAKARPVTQLSEAQAFALMNHLSYWFGDRQPADPPEPGTVARDY